MRIVIVSCLFFLGTIAFAQKSWQKNMATADAFLQVHEYANAAKYYEFALNNNRSADVILKLAECKELLREFDQAANWYRQALRYKSSKEDVILKCARAHRNAGKYSLAKKYYKQYLSKSIDSLVGKNELAYCDSALKWMEKDFPISVKNMSKINTIYSDVAPTFYYEALLFSSNREGAVLKKKHGQTNEAFYNLYLTTKKDNGKWEASNPFGSVNSRNHDGAACFDKTYTSVYFTRSEHTQGQNENHSDQNRLKLYKADKKHVGWTVAERFILNDSLYSFAHPSMSADGKFFYFTSDLPGGFGGFDIYVCVKVDENNWSAPINLGREVNSAGNEMYPWYDQNTKKLYFSSDGHLGMGGYDLYSTSLNQGNWSHVENLKYPINSSSDDFSIIWQNERLAYLCSNRKGGKGKEDLYQVQK